MEAIKAQTMWAMLDQMPSHECLGEEIEELVAPRYGVISGFQEILDAIDKLQDIDLGETSPF